MKNNFTKVPNALITDARISMGARNLYAYIASKPAKWVFNRSHICHELGITLESLLKMCNELTSVGWMTKSQGHGEKGRFSPCEYKLTTVSGNSVHGETAHGSTVHGKSAHLVRLNNSKTDINKTECERGDKSPAHTLDYFIQQTKAAQAALKAEGMKADRVVVMKFHNYWTQVMDDGRMLWETKPFDFTNRLRNWLMGEYATV